MRFATRIFLWSFVPLAAILALNFWVVRSAVVSTVREGLVASVRQNQLLLADEHIRSQRENARLLKVVSENPSLKAGLQLLRTDPASDVARLTVEDQLTEICGALGFDFLMIGDVAGRPLAGIVRKATADPGASNYASADLSRMPVYPAGLMQLDAGIYQVASVPMEQSEETVGTLMVGEMFDMAKFPTPAVLLRNGLPIATNLAGFPLTAAGELKNCKQSSECEFKVQSDSYVSLPLSGSDPASMSIPGAASPPLEHNPSTFELRSLQDIDAASAPIQATVRGVFLTAELTALIATLGVGLLGSRSIVKPLADVVARLRESSKTGSLPEFSPRAKEIQEIHELMDSFNHASSAVHQSREDLLRAYVEFVGSLAQALDARDPYTAGHSRRVSEYSCAIAEAMSLPSEELQIIRIGALLHDVGKIGISDAVLQKPGRLTPEEDALIRQHPTIGRKILEGVHGFEAYLPVVESHHENWDGTGYPRGLKAEETALSARIVKVADAFDAMTSDRPYRLGMARERAIAVLRRNTHTEFDAVVVEAFASINTGSVTESALAEVGALNSILPLEAAVRRESPADVSARPGTEEGSGWGPVAEELPTVTAATSNPKEAST